MCHTPHVQLIRLEGDDIRQRINGGKRLRLLDEIEEEFLGHHIGIHEDILLIRRAHIGRDGQNSLLLIEIEHAAAQIGISGVIDTVIQQGHIGAARHMIIQELAVILFVDHVTGSHDHIGQVHALDDLVILQKTCDIVIVDRLGIVDLREQQLQLPSLGVDIVMTSRPDMLRDGTRAGAHIDLDLVDPGIAHIGYGEVDHTVSPEEGECPDRPVIMQSFHMKSAGCRGDHAECLVCHRLSPPSLPHFPRPAGCFHCSSCRRRLPCRSGLHPPRVHG